MKNTHGGARPNSGRKKMAGAGKKRSRPISIRINPETLSMIDADRDNCGGRNGGPEARDSYILRMAGYVGLTDKELTENRFMGRVDVDQETGCWIWRNKGGYGQFCYHGKSKLAHRFSYEFFVGDIPEDMLVCHTCDVRECVNPDHLFVGTAQDNYDDMVEKGRRNAAPHKYNEPIIPVAVRLPESLLQAIDVAVVRDGAKNRSEWIVTALRKATQIPEGI